MSTYAWSGPDGYSSADQSPLVSGSSTLSMDGTYTLTVTDGNGCTQTASTVVEVNTLPTATANSNSPVCEGSPLTLTGGDNGMSTYAWSGPDGYSSTDQSPLVSGSSTLSMDGTYTLTVTDAAGCTSIASTTVTVNALPTATAGSNSPVCVGSPLTLTGGENGMISYAWSGPDGYSSTDQSPLVSSNSTLSMDGTYTLTVTHGNGCTETASTVVEVNPVPTATASSNSPVCVGSPLTLTGGENGMSSYAWIGPDGYSSANQSPLVSGSATLLMDGLYTLTITDGNGCTDIATANVSVNENPVVAIIPDPAETCENDDLPMDGNPSGGSGTYVTHQWSGSGAIHLSDDAIQTPDFNAPNAGSYDLFYFVEDDNGCEDSGSVTVSVIGAPSAFAGSGDAICYGTSYHLSDADTSNADSLVWKTLGDGTFDDSTTLHPVYMPGLNDLDSGFVYLYLNAYSGAGCGMVSDTMRLDIAPQLNAFIGAPAPFLISSSTKIYIRLSTKDHSLAQDLSIYLGTPDGDMLLIKKADYLDMCSFPQNYKNVLFTTDTNITKDPMDICDYPGDITGIFI